MKLANIHYQGVDRLAVVVNDKVDNDKVDNDAIDNEQLLDLTATGLPATMRQFIELGDAGLEAAKQALGNVDEDHLIATDEILWHPPVREPRKVLCIAMNNATSNARKISAPDHPLYFNKAASSLIGHKQPIVLYDYYGSVHPEPELAVIIGKRAWQIAAEDAYEYVYGYTNLNDVTGNGMRAEDRVHYYALYASSDDPTVLERREQHLSYPGRYKSVDTFGPIGPYLVTKDDVPDPNNLDVHCSWGGETIAQDSTAYYNYPVHEALAFLSRFHTLEPGDIVSMGTAFKSSPDSKRSLHLANLNQFPRTVTMSITGLGTLVSPVKKRES